jgi:hypothetical protein
MVARRDFVSIDIARAKPKRYVLKLKSKFSLKITSKLCSRIGRRNRRERRVFDRYSENWRIWRSSEKPRKRHKSVDD